jgi:uncharacterized membrane protein YgaE (UPF0421/DUF939 family)
VIALGIVPGNHVRRAVEIMIGVGIGIAVGDLLIAGIGHGSWQVALVVLLAMAGAVLVGGGTLVVSQAAASGVLVATLSASTHGAVPTRFVDALVGGGVALVVLAVAPRSARTILTQAAAPVFTALVTALEEIASALAAHDVDASNRALEQARGLDELVAGLRSTVALATETTRLAPIQRHERSRAGRYAAATPHVGYAARNTRVLARAAVRAVELEPFVPEGIVTSVRELAVAVRALETALDTGADDGAPAVRRATREAAALASAALDEGGGFAIGVLVGQVRSIAMDVLRALGVERLDAVALLRGHAGISTEVR